MDNQILFFTEGEKYTVSKYKKLVDYFSELIGLMEECGSVFSFKVTGLLMHHDYPIVVFPKGYTISENDHEKRKDASILIRVLLRYRSKHFLLADEIRLLNGDRTNKNGRIISAITVLEDYVDNGYLQRNTDKVSKYTRGRIDWGKTLKQTAPIFGKSGLVYPEPIMKSHTVDYDNLVFLIHKSIVCNCSKLYGWLLQDNLKIDEIDLLPCSIVEALIVLNRELHNSYSQREIHLFNAMIMYLTSLSDNNGAGFEVLATPLFQNVWESICGYIYGNHYSELRVIVPKPVWKNSIVSGAISQRPDILFFDDKTLYILDAKYYNYKFTLPGWHDIVKQYFYKFTIEKNMEANPHLRKRYSNMDKIINAFILPGNSENEIVHLGNLAVENVNELGEILVFAINTKVAMECYAFRKSSNHRPVLKDMIRSL